MRRTTASAETEAARPPWLPVVLALGRSVLTAGLLVLVYSLLPIARFDVWPFLYFLAGAVAFAAVLVLQLRQISRATRPELRAIESVGLLLALAIVVFAAIYFVTSDQDPSAFTEPLSRVDAIYFSAMVLSTVGFGDIAPLTDQSRILVTVQMVVDLVLVVVVIRMIRTAVGRGPKA